MGSHYEILAQIGAGGMGEVYRARDTRLNRDVAIKILPDVFAQDPDRMARFAREAQLVAALNHPNIAQIYGVEDRALIMELVEGKPLQGPLPLETALRYAVQIASALEAAHEKGIVHRDLKPVNIMVTPAGAVKVLDFGLAKATEPSTPPADPAHSPTLTMSATRVGMILGTAAYMAPEQARGKPVDARADIWAFGVVLYEMVTGRPAFAGETVTDILASVVKEQPALEALPGRVRRIVERCLQKDPRQRWQAAGDLRLEIETILADPRGVLADDPVSASAPLWKRAIPVAAAAVLAAAVTAAGFWRFPTVAPPPISRFSIPLPEDQAFTNSGRRVVAISPDGTQFAYVANHRLYLRRLAEFESHAIPGADSSAGVLSPSFSPDGRSMAYYDGSDSTIKRIASGGGVPVTVCPAVRVYGIHWDTTGILFGQGSQGIFRVSPDGGRAQPIATIQVGELAADPSMLPDGKTLLFSLTANGGDWDQGRILAMNLQSGARKTVIEGGSNARYLPTGHIVYAVSGSLFAVPFNARRVEVTGGATPVVQGVMRGLNGSAQFDAAENGSLIYLPGPTSAKSLYMFAFVNRESGVETLKLPGAQYHYPRVSRDGKRLAYEIDADKDSSTWVYDLSGASAPRRLTFQGSNRFPVWSADGERIAFQSDREGDLGIFWQRADGTGPVERLTKPERAEAHMPDSFTPDGRYLSFTTIQGGVATVRVLSLRDRKDTLFAEVPSSRAESSMFSPDGRWLAYAVPTEPPTGNPSVYVQPFPPSGAKYQIPGAVAPLWSSDGKHLLVGTGPGNWADVRVSTASGLSFSEPAPFQAGGMAGSRLGPRQHDVLPDGRLIGVVAPTPAQARSALGTPINVVINWFEDVKQRVPAR